MPEVSKCAPLSIRANNGHMIGAAPLDSRTRIGRLCILDVKHQTSYQLRRQLRNGDFDRRIFLVDELNGRRVATVDDDAIRLIGNSVGMSDNVAVADGNAEIVVCQIDALVGPDIALLDRGQSG